MLSNFTQLNFRKYLR